MTNTNLAIRSNNTSLPNANLNTPMTTNDQFDFLASLRPAQFTQIYLEHQRSETALTVERWRLDNSLWLSDKENQNKFEQMQYQANTDYQREAMKGQNAAALADKEHANRMEQIKLKHNNQLERMQVELQNHKAIAEFNTELSIIPKLMEEDGKGRTSILARMECSHKDQDKTLYMLRESFVQDRLAKRQHDRQIAQLHAEWELKNEIQGI